MDKHPPSDNALPPPSNTALPRPEPAAHISSKPGDPATSLQACVAALLQKNATLLQGIRKEYAIACAIREKIQDKSEAELQSVHTCDFDRAIYLAVLAINRSEVKKLEALLAANVHTDRIWAAFQSEQNAALQQITVNAAHNACLHSMTRQDWNSPALQQPLQAQAEAARASYRAGSHAIGETLAEALHLFRQAYADTSQPQHDDETGLLKNNLAQALSECNRAQQKLNELHMSYANARHSIILLDTVNSENSIKIRELNALIIEAENTEAYSSNVQAELDPLLESGKRVLKINGPELTPAEINQFHELMQSFSEIADDFANIELRFKALCPPVQEPARVIGSSTISLAVPDRGNVDIRADQIPPDDEAADAPRLPPETYPAQDFSQALAELEIPETANYLL